MPQSTRAKERAARRKTPRPRYDLHFKSEAQRRLVLRAVEASGFTTVNAWLVTVITKAARAELRQK